MNRQTSDFESNALPFSFVVAFSIRAGIYKVKLERAIGFEPTINGFADRRLCPLGYARIWILDFGFWICFQFENQNKVGEDDGARTRNLQLEGLAA